MTKDYLDVEYNSDVRPLTDYPSLLAGYIAGIATMKPGQSLLEIGSGRAELARGFVSAGLEVTCIDSAPSAAEFARTAGAQFIEATIREDLPLPVPPDTFDFIFAKSFIEHLRAPLSFMEGCRAALHEGGYAVFLTPDWEANYKIFFDDVTHVTPFSRATMQQTLELAGFSEIQVFRFRQLPSTWRNPFINLVSASVAPFVPVRTTNKFLRWSRELMLCGIGRRHLE